MIILSIHSYVKSCAKQMSSCDNILTPVNIRSLTGLFFLSLSLSLVH